MSPQGVMSGEKASNRLDWILLKNRNLALSPRKCPEISSRDCLWVSPRTCRRTHCWVTNQRLIPLRTSCLETPRAGSRPRYVKTEPPLASSSAISLPRTPARPETQYSPTTYRVKILMETSLWPPEELSKQPINQSRCSCISLVYSEIEFHKHTAR